MAAHRSCGRSCGGKHNSCHGSRLGRGQRPVLCIRKPHHFLSQEAGALLFAAHTFVSYFRFICNEITTWGVNILETNNHITCGYSVSLFSNLLELHSCFSFSFSYELSFWKHSLFWGNKCGWFFVVFLAEQHQPSLNLYIPAPQGYKTCTRTRLDSLSLSSLWQSDSGAQGSETEPEGGRGGVVSGRVKTRNRQFSCLLAVLMWKSERWIIHNLWEVNNDVPVIKGRVLMSWREEGFPPLSDLSTASPSETRNKWN